MIKSYPQQLQVASCRPALVVSKAYAAEGNRQIGKTFQRFGTQPAKECRTDLSVDRKAEPAGEKRRLRTSLVTGYQRNSVPTSSIGALK